MRSFSILAVAGLLASAAAMPMNDQKYSEDKEVKHYDDGKMMPEGKMMDDHKYDDKMMDDKKYDDKEMDDKEHDHSHGDDKYDDKDDKDDKEGLSAFPFHFTSTYYAKALPDQIIAANGSSVPGQEGAVGYYSFGINSAQEVICYNITLVGVTGAYQSPARTATHIHESARGQFGPPRIAFPNPQGSGNVRTSFGCLQGPFTTGINNTATGQDQGAGFSLSEIEANPSGFNADVHTVAPYVAGAVRGQLMKK